MMTRPNIKDFKIYTETDMPVGRIERIPSILTRMKQEVKLYCAPQRIEEIRADIEGPWSLIS